MQGQVRFQKWSTEVIRRGFMVRGTSLMNKVTAYTPLWNSNSPTHLSFLFAVRDNKPS